MPNKKSNHYVPRTHFRPFSKEREGRSISLLNLKSMNFVENASVSGQCAKDYFYGKDGNLEDWFARIERAYGLLIGKLNGGAKLDQEDLSFLRDYALLQHLRTEQSLKQDKLAQTRMLDMVFHDAEHQKPDFDMTFPGLAASSVAMFQEAVKFVDDLSVCLVENDTKIEFITSDDPSVRLNRFQQKRRKFDGYDAGIMAAGEMLILPVSPRYAIIAYDKNVYRVEGLKGLQITTRIYSDVRSINELQYLNASRNLYFSGWEQRSEMAAEATRLASFRRKDRFAINYAVFDHKTENSEVFRAVKDMSEVNGSERAIIATHIWALRPTQWPSFLKYRSKPKYLVVGAAGDWMRRDDKEFDETPFYF